MEDENEKLEKEKEPEPLSPSDKNEIINELNGNKVRNLLMAWTVIGRNDAVEAKVVDVTKEKLTFEIVASHWRTKAKEIIVDSYEFSSEHSNKTEVLGEIDTLRSASSLSVWPTGPIPYVSVFLWLFFIAGMVSKYKPGSPYFNFLKLFASSFMTPSTAKIGLYLVAGSHVLEACYVGYILKPLQLGTLGMMSWMSLTFLLGYPVTEKAIFLSKYWQKNKNNNLDKKNS